MTSSLAERRQRRPGRATADDHDIEKLFWDDGFDLRIFALDRSLYKLSRLDLAQLSAEASERLMIVRRHVGLH